MTETWVLLTIAITSYRLTIRMWVQTKGSPNQCATAVFYQKKSHAILFPLFSLFLVLSSEPDDEMTGLASSSEKCGARSSHRLPVKDWKASPRGSPKLWRKSKRDNGYVKVYKLRYVLMFSVQIYVQVASLILNNARATSQLLSLFLY